VVIEEVDGMVLMGVMEGQEDIVIKGGILVVGAINNYHPVINTSVLTCLQINVVLSLVKVAKL